MKISIRTKLFIQICCLIIFFVVFSWILNTRYLTKYYVSNKENVLIKKAKSINSLYHGDPEKISTNLEQISQASNLRIYILDKNYNIKYDSFIIPGGQFKKLPQPLHSTINSGQIMSIPQTNANSGVALKNSQLPQQLNNTRQNAQVPAEILQQQKEKVNANRNFQIPPSTLQQSKKVPIIKPNVQVTPQIPQQLNKATNSNQNNPLTPEMLQQQKVNSNKNVQLPSSTSPQSNSSNSTLPVKQLPQVSQQSNSSSSMPTSQVPQMPLQQNSSTLTTNQMLQETQQLNKATNSNQNNTITPEMLQQLNERLKNDTNIPPPSTASQQTNNSGNLPVNPIPQVSKKTSKSSTALPTNQLPQALPQSNSSSTQPVNRIPQQLNKQTSNKQNPQIPAEELEKFKQKIEASRKVQLPTAMLPQPSNSNIPQFVNQMPQISQQSNNGSSILPILYNAQIAKLIEDDIKNILQGKYSIKVTKDERLKTESLNIACKLNNSDYLALSTPLAAIEENAQVANNFFFITGLITILFGALMTFIFSRRFTKPIYELNNIAQKMADLDFSIKYKTKSQDEIGQLGENINILSEQLDNAITDLQKANACLQKDIEHERSIDEMRKKFISDVSHELKTPIALIHGYAESLKYDIVESKEDKTQYCNVILDESKRMNKLVWDLLDLSTIESGYFKLERSSFDVSLLIDQVLEKFTTVFKDKGIKLIIEKEPSIYVNADSVRIEQVLINYVNNAINHLDERNTIKIIAVTQKDTVKISVINYGQPIPKEHLDKIWMSFYKVDKARTRSKGGNGLGLSIVKAILDVHHNKYGVNNLSDGVEFWFELSL